MISRLWTKAGRGALTAILLGVGLAEVARAEEPTTIAVIIKDHKFIPADIHVAAGKATILAIRNDDGTVEEFDSSALKVEKVIAPGATANVRLRPLGPGTYPFMGEYHAGTAQGAVIAE